MSLLLLSYTFIKNVVNCLVEGGLVIPETVIVKVPEFGITPATVPATPPELRVITSVSYREAVVTMAELIGMVTVVPETYNVMYQNLPTMIEGWGCRKMKFTN